MAYRNYHIIYEDENDIKRTYFTVSKTAQEAVKSMILSQTMKDRTLIINCVLFQKPHYQKKNMS